MQAEQTTQSPQQDTTTDVTVRDVPAHLWREARAMAFREGKQMGRWIGEAIAAKLTPAG